MMKLFSAGILAKRFQYQLHRELSLYWIARSPCVLKALHPYKEDRVLDLGCGQGMWTHALANRVRWIVSLDISETSVRETKRKADEMGIDNAAYVIASATALPFKKESFNKIVCIDVLDNIPEDGRAGRELKQVLTRNGQLVTTVLLKDRRHYLRTIRYPEHIRNYSKTELINLLTASGFRTGWNFYFYHSFSTILWELGYILHHSRISTLPGIGLIIGLILSNLARLDNWGTSRPGAGIGVAANKVESL